MRASDIFGLALNSLIHRRLRSWLTIIGVVIGVAALVALVSMGESISANVSRQLGGFGADIISVSPGVERAVRQFGPPGQFSSTSGGNLTENDAISLRNIPGILYVAGSITERKDVSYAAKTASLSVHGVDAAIWRYVVTTELEQGRYLTSGDAGSAVVGNGTANEVFEKPVALNSIIFVGGQSFRVVGILKASAGFGSQDRAIFITKEAARGIMAVGTNQLSAISVKVTYAERTQEIADAIKNRLRLLHHLASGKEDFTVTSAAAVQERVSAITGTITTFLGSIAVIALLVGAIGIANTMFMTVLERTRQIGVMKALGMKNSSVMLLYLTESSLIGLIGGLIGVLAGVVAANFLPNLLPFGPRAGGQAVAIVISPELLGMAIAFSVAIGALSGVIPARRAAKLLPIEALRYE